MIQKEKAFHKEKKSFHASHFPDTHNHIWVRAMTNRQLGTTTMAPLEWIPLPFPAAPEALGGQQLSQVVFEDVGVPTPTKQPRQGHVGAHVDWWHPA